MPTVNLVSTLSPFHHDTRYYEKLSLLVVVTFQVQWDVGNTRISSEAVVVT
jgi:hypothetical protein